MRRSLRSRHARIALGAVVLAVGLFAGPLNIQATHAYVSHCNLDPTIYLSNGDVVTMDVSLNDSIPDVQDATFLLRVPWGVSAVGVVKDANSDLETVLVQQSNTYSTDTIVNTYTSGVQATASSSLASGRGEAVERFMSGLSGQHLVIRLRSREDQQ